MKKIKKPLIAALSATVALASLLSLAACGPVKDKPQKLTDLPLQTEKLVDYTLPDSDRSEMFASGSKGFSWENGAPFNVWWKHQNVSYEDNKLSLSLSEMTEKELVWDEEKEEFVKCNAEYYGAEERSEHYYGYGDYQVRMKPAKIVGTASTFFTCTGNYDKWYDEDGETVLKENKHDEIDIEFLGKDTTKVQFNYYADDHGGHEYMYNLGFDASEEYHDYGFRWAETYITWFVDGKPVYRIDRKGNEAWPEDPGRVIVNYWCGTPNVIGWMGKFDDDYSGKAEYEYVATGATQCPDPNTAHIKEKPPVGDDDTVLLDVPTEGWTDIATDGFDGWGNYTVNKTDGLNISHATAKKVGWECCGMDLADCYSWVKFKVKNNAEVAADIRLHIGIKGQNNTNAVKAISPANQNISVSSDSAALIHLDAGEELEIALQMKEAYANQFTVFLNSTGALADRAETGDITITGLKGIITEGADIPEPAEELPVKIGDNEVTFTGDYTVAVSDDKTSMIIEYADVSGKSYKNISASIADIVGNKNVFTVTIKNEGEATAKIRIDIGCNVEDGSSKTNGGETPDEKNNFCNIKPEYIGTVAGSGDDYDWGGADWLQIAANETVTVKITFTEGVAKDVKFYIDSSTYNDETTHSGKVVFSDMNLSKGAEENNPSIAEDRLTADGDKIAVFTNGDSSAFSKADGWKNDDEKFNCTWRADNINFDGGTMNMSITTDNNGYAGGEYRSNADYSFGYYSVSMKPAKCTGTVSSFFTYTDSPRWDEIDIEFLGKDTTKVQFNYYTNGVGNHEYLFDLGFDASEGFHEYGFYWQSDCIIWYVDGKAVYKATEDIPQYAGKIITNVWNGTGVDEWLGAFDDTNLPVTAQYKWIAYKAD